MSAADELNALPMSDDEDERRARVKEMMMRGVRIGTMAKILSVDRATVRKDTKAIRQEMMERYKNFDSKTGLGECADALDMLARRAALEAEKTKNKRSRNAFLNTSIRAWVAKAHVLSDPGVVPTAIGGLAKIAITKLDEGDYSEKVKDVLKDPNSRRKLLGVLNTVVKASKPKNPFLKEAEVIDPSKPTNGGNGDGVESDD